MMNKKGVSLIAVLLFMMIATIAGTATYKWLTSENRSSASRMQQSEANQAAIAGIESARSWMTYHGNELGAIIKQYFAGGKTPVSLDRVINKGIENDKQNFSVAIVAVDTHGATYKVKIVSTGTSRNGSKHSESAIMKVSGLYKVVVPHERRSADYNYSYFGGSTTYSGSTEMTSVLVNGNWSGNPPKTTTGDFVVTGNASLSGSDIDVGGATCVGGNLDANNAITSKDLYVVGTTSGTAMNITTSGDAYFVGNIQQGQQPITIGGSLTTEGIVKTNASAVTFTVAKNLCVEPGGQIYQDNFSRAFTVSGNVWMPGHNPVYTGATDANNYDKIILGNTAESQVYIADAYPHSSYKAMRDSKEFTENNREKKYCPSPISSEDRWEIVINDGGSANKFTGAATKDICGTWGVPHWENWLGGAYYVKYTRGWKNWEGQKYKPYKDVPSKPNMYYFYYTGGVNDVEFKTYDNNNWMYYVGTGVNADQIGLVVSRESPKYYDGWGYGIRNSREFKPNPGPVQLQDKFRKPTPIGAYHVGGQVFYDLNTYSLYNVNYVNEWNKTVTGSPYCYKSSDPYRPECGVSPWFTSLGTVSNTMPTTKPFTCAEDVKTHCDEIWQKKPGCDGSSYKVDDILQIADDAFTPYANKAQCVKDIISMDPNDRNNFNVNKINECYKNLKNDRDSAAARLYNGYLVIDFPNGSWFKGTQGSLDGKFVFIIDSKNGEAMKMPPMTSNSYVMLYLPEGYNELQQTSPSATNNYFIFSKGDITNMQSGYWKGSIYMTAESCAKVGNFKTSQLEFYQKLVDDMSYNGIICKADAASCGGAASSGESSTSEGSASEEFSTDGYDDDYIAIGPQLHIEMESEYKNTEEFANASAVAPSITVLPRIIYLTQDAVGKLSDYYNVLALNGAEISGNGIVSCNGTTPPPVTGSLVTEGNPLTEGFYSCSYTEGNYKSGFYVSVSGTTSETPRVKFDGDAEVQMNGMPTQTVYLVVPGVVNNVDAEYSVDIMVINDNLSGWTITALDGVEEQTGSSSDKIYTYVGRTSSTTNTIPIFTVNAASGAKSGSVIFVLQTPVNATVSNPSSKSFNLYGSATVKRAEIAAYCELYDCSGTVFDEIKNDDNCETDAQWIRANGSDCRVKIAGAENREWICNAGNGNVEPITLSALSYDHNFCELYIPTENNSIVGALDDAENPEGYVLYASLKKKRFNLHVGFSNTDKGRIIVKTREKTTDDWTSKTCDNRSNGCDYNLFTNTYVELEIDPNGDNFSYWSCSGSSCKQQTYNSTSVGLVMDNNYSFTARFNEIDDHCFYTNFDGGTAFCTASADKSNCIDRCKSATHCSVGNGVYQDSRWLMVYPNSNKTGWKAPNFDKDGYISYNGGTNVNNQSGYQGLILNSSVAGGNGTLTARVKTTGSLAWNKSNEFLNSGFILRSNENATEYIMLNIYGKYDGLLNGGRNTHARICYATEQGINNSTKCVEKLIKTKGAGTSPVLTDMTVINLSINLDGEKIHIDFNYQSDLLSWLNAEVDFDLSKDWSYGSLIGNPYVGFKISDADFKISDIGWEAADFSNDACFDYPSVTCSFASNYLGGKIPVETDAAPWVGFSSWFVNQGTACTSNIKYYYNGCDVPYSYYSNRWTGLANSMTVCQDKSSDGFYKNVYGEDGLALNRTTNPYKFEYEGNHGYMHADGQGYVRNASIVVTCDGREYKANCGEFFVGELKTCSMNEILQGSSLNLTSYEHSIVLDHNVNLRDAMLVFDISGLSEIDYVDFALEDANGIKTSERSVTNNNKSFDVNEMSNQYGFNPEVVKKVYLTGSNSYTLNSIKSSCPNAVGIECKSVLYNGAAWQIQAQYVNGSNARKCRAESNSSDITSTGMVDCSDYAKFYLEDADFYDRLNTGSESSLSYDFTLYVYDDDEATELSTPAGTCSISSEAKTKSSITCDIDGSSVVQGAGVPKLTYGIIDCPDYGCAYDVRLSNGTSLSESAKEPNPIPASGRTGLEWTPNVNTISDYLSENTYYYTVTTKSPKDGNKVYGTCTTPSFTVQKAVEATGSCSISGDYLSVNVSGANNQDVPVTLTYNDAIGINLGYSTITMNESKTESINLKETLPDNGSYTIVLRVNQTDYTCGTYTTATTSLTCPADVSNQDPAQQISVTPTVSGCENNSCSWRISGPTSANGSGYGGGAISFSHNASGTQTYKLTLSRVGAVSKDCNFNVTFKDVPASATCSFSKTPYIGQSVNLNVSNIQGVSGEAHPTWTVGSESKTIDCNSSSCWSNSMTMPATAGSYSYALTLGSQTMCSGTVEVKDPLTCSVDKTEIGIGESFTLTTAYAGACWTSSLTGNGVPSANCGSSYSVTPTVVGSQNYTYSVTGGENGASSCTKTVVVKEKAPTCSVTNMEKMVGATNIEIKPTSTGCTNGPCSYEVTGGTKGGTSGTVYYDVDVSLGTTLTGETTVGSKTYTLTLTNSVGDGSCDFDIDYKTESVSTCHAPAGCENPVTSGSFSYNGSCYFATSIDYMNSSSTYKINGDSRTGWHGNNNWPAKIDGGYYIQTENSSDYGSALTLGTPDCSGGSGGGGSGGGSGSTSVSASAVEFTPGTYSITCSGGGQLICWNPNGGEFEFTFDGSPCKAYGGEGWGSCGGGTCSSSQKTLTTSKTVRCKGGW